MTCEACKTIPPVVVEGYKTKGEFKEVAGLKTYVTGSPDSKKAIVDIYDVFGLTSQTLQGADLLAAAVGCVILVPDLLKGEVAKEEWFTSQDPEIQKDKGAFFALLGFGENGKKLTDFMRGAKTEWKGVESWGAFGLCRGGKVVVLASGEGTLFKATGQVHPGRLDVEDAKKVVIPHIILASNGEDEKVVAQCKEVLVGEGKPGVVESYMNMHHGWTRAKLHEAENLKEYERGYNQLAAYFHKYL